MEENQPKIKIDDPISRIDAKFDLYIKFVIGVLVVAVLTMIFMVGGILLDALHFNSAVYKEYSQKTELVEDNQKISKELLDQNQKNQQLILQQQKQILELLKK